MTVHKEEGCRLLFPSFLQKALCLLPEWQQSSPQLLRQPPGLPVAVPFPFPPVFHAPGLIRMSQQAVAEHVQKLQAEPPAVLQELCPQSFPVQIKYFSVRAKTSLFFRPLRGFCAKFQRAEQGTEAAHPLIELQPDQLKNFLLQRVL